MNGVEILNQTNVYEEKGLIWIFFLLLIIGFMAGLIMTIVDWCKFGFDSEGILVIILSIMLGCVLGGLGYICSIHKTDKLDYVEYKVTISDEVDFNEFMDKYKILDKEGKIYTVKENK